MLKIGVLGAGSLGKIHLELIRRIPAFELVGFFDIDPQVAREVSERFGVKAFNSAEELIRACDAVDIVTPTIAHYECAEKAIRQSRHVFIEKPLTHTIAEAKSLQRLAAEANVNVQVGHAERFNPAFLSARRFLEDIQFIEAHRLARFNPKEPNVSVVLDLMIHDIDIVLSVVKANIRRVHASGVIVASDSPDMASARIEFDNGTVANLTASRISTEHLRRTKFYQNQAYVSVDFLEKRAEIVRLSNSGSAFYNLQQEPESIDVNSLKNIELTEFKMRNASAIRTELELFAQCILEQKRPVVPIDDGFKSLDVAHKIIDQLRMNANFAAHTINA